MLNSLGPWCHGVSLSNGSAKKCVYISVCVRVSVDGERETETKCGKLCTITSM